MTEPDAAMPLTITLFGPMQVFVEGSPLPHLRSRKSLWLLALLTLRRSRPVEREWLAGTLWPDADPKQSLTSLRTVLSDLRKALGSQSERLRSPNRHTLALGLEGADVDVLAFDAAIKSGTRDALEQATALYRGPLLEGCAEEWVGQERGAREQDCLKALKTLADADLESGSLSAAIGYYRRIVGMDPWAEAARRGLMQALANEGDTNAALRVYREFVEVLRDDPKAAPDAQTTALYARLRDEARRKAAAPVAAPTASVPTVTGHLPHPLTDLVGREDECLEVAAALRRSRLVTLTGPGGIGKTRLAIEVASRAAQERAAYTDGIWLVPLEALAEGKRVDRQIASALGLQEEPGRSARNHLADHLRARRVLLVLDNCEHLIEAAAQTAAYLLRECAGVRILATSREALGITGETTWSVPALTVPDVDHLPTKPTTLVRVLVCYESVQLFVERAQAIRTNFALTGENASAVAQICARLGGLPLAIELAAARVKAMTVAQIAARLDDHLSLLTGGDRASLPRQQTLRATLDWSYALLTITEQILLSRLSVFAGSWDLEAAEQVCAGGTVEPGQIADLLTSLVDKSLVVFDAGELEGRYRLLEMVRQYAAGQLTTRGETERTRSKHTDWCLAVAERIHPSGAETEKALRRLKTEHENLRSALAWCDGDPNGAETALRLASALWQFWYMRGHFGEGLRHLQQALGREEVRGTSAARARALTGAGALSYRLGDLVLAKACNEECLQIQRELGNREGIAISLNELGNSYATLGHYEVSKALREESLTIFRERNNLQRVAWCLYGLGGVAHALGDYTSARSLYGESLSIRRALRNKTGSAISLMGLANVLREQGEYHEARTLLEESLTLYQEIEAKYGIAWSLNYLGDVALDQSDSISARALYTRGLTLFREVNDLEGIMATLRGMSAVMRIQKDEVRAAYVLSAADALRERTGIVLFPSDQRKDAQWTEQIRAILGEDAFASAYAEGRALTWEQVVAQALEET